MATARIDLEKVKEVLSGKKSLSPEGKRIGHNTRMERRMTSVAIRYHSTDIVTFHDDGTATLRTGGWNTASTLGRFRRLGMSIFRRDGQTILEGSDGVEYLFKEGMKVSFLDDGVHVLGGTPVFAGRFGRFVGRDLRTLDELEESIAALCPNALVRAWNKFKKERPFIAGKCDLRLLPLLLGESGPWTAVIEKRLKN